MSHKEIGPGAAFMDAPWNLEGHRKPTLQLALKMARIKLDRYLAKRKNCPHGQTYRETWNAFLGEHVKPFDVVCKVGSLACSKCPYFDKTNFGQAERPSYIVCNYKK